MHKRIFFFAAVASFLALGAVAGCDDSDSSNNPFNPGGGGDAGRDSGGADAGDGGSNPDGGCSNTPTNCFCGTPTTQAQWLNRCTKSAAIPFTKTVKPATTANLP